MVDLSEAQIAALAVHKVGSKLRDGGMVLSDSLFQLNDEIRPILEDYFFKPFRKGEFFWQFTHETDLSLNEVYTYTTAIFDSKRAGLLTHSVSMAKHLYAQSTHPNIKGGELYVAWITGCQIDGVLMDAVGIFKSENKDTFLHVGGDDEGDSVPVKAEQGINIKRLDKGALIFNTFAEDGYSLLMVDKAQEEGQYWRDDFLHINRIQDDSFYTEAYLDMCGDFVEEVYSQTESKKDQVVFMNDTINFFATSKEFDAEAFENNVALNHPEVAQAFTMYKNKFEEEREITGEEGFKVSKQAITEAKRRFKSLIKLDTGVEIKIDPKKGQTEYVERGFDTQLQMGYYKVYFNQEE